jgi:hypothetical protein
MLPSLQFRGAAANKCTERADTRFFGASAGGFSAIAVLMLVQPDVQVSWQKVQRE